jgi:hypothetical protein
MCTEPPCYAAFQTLTNSQRSVYLCNYLASMVCVAGQCGDKRVELGGTWYNVGQGQPTGAVVAMHAVQTDRQTDVVAWYLLQTRVQFFNNLERIHLACSCSWACNPPLLPHGTTDCLAQAP